MATIPCTNPKCKNGNVKTDKRDPLTGHRVQTSGPCSKCGGSGTVSTEKES